MERKVISSDIHPDLTDDRLKKIAELILNQRKDVVDKREIDRGDDAWSIGCRAYSWTRNAISKAASTDSSFAPWLKVLEDKGLYFTFTIGEVPIKFYSGDPDHLPVKASYFRTEEFLARQYAFPSMNDENSFLFRLIIETDASLEATAITLVQIGTYGNTINSWLIDLTESHKVTPLTSTSVKLPKPRIRVKKPTKEETKIGKSNDE